jgi:hypothetical protein
VGANDTRLDGGFVLREQISHHLREIPVVDDASNSPCAGTSNRASLPPPPHDDDEVTPA